MVLVASLPVSLPGSLARAAGLPDTGRLLAVGWISDPTGLGEFQVIRHE
jgi:hypothetical protein